MSFWDDLLDGLGSLGSGAVDVASDFIDSIDADDIGNLIRGFVGGSTGGVSNANIAGILGALGGNALGLFDPNIQKVGYTGGIPQYTAVRERVPMPEDPNRRPGSGGRRYFSDTTYAKTDAPERPSLEAARQMATAQAQGIAQNQNLPPPPPPREDEALPFPLPPEDGMGMAAGGIAALAKGRYLRGGTDGMEDRINTSIDGKQPAKLSHGEFVIPADVVSHLGNGNSEAGAKQLYAMMDRIRQARTGTKKQGRQVKAQKYLPA